MWWQEECSLVACYLENVRRGNFLKMIRGRPLFLRVTHGSMHLRRRYHGAQETGAEESKGVKEQNLFVLRGEEMGKSGPTHAMVSCHNSVRRSLESPHWDMSVGHAWQQTSLCLAFRIGKQTLVGGSTNCMEKPGNRFPCSGGGVVVDEVCLFWVALFELQGVVSKLYMWVDGVGEMNENVGIGWVNFILSTKRLDLV